MRARRKGRHGTGHEGAEERNRKRFKKRASSRECFVWGGKEGTFGAGFGLDHLSCVGDDLSEERASDLTERLR